MSALAERLRGLAAALAVAVPALAQCSTPWLPNGGIPGTDGIVNRTVRWDPDGAGPAAAVLVLAGAFTQAGPIVASGIAAFDATTGTWTTFGSGLGGYARTVAVLGNGDLVVGGTFATAGGTAAANVARWNGSSWAALGAGTDGSVDALLALANGDLVAAGAFTQAGGTPAARIARFDGTTWSALGSGCNGEVRRLVQLPNGDLVAGGDFTVAGGTGANHVARWDGTAWQPLGTGTDGFVTALAVLPNGDLAVGGLFTTAGGLTVDGAAVWNGSTWSVLGDPDCVPIDFASTPSGDLVCAGYTGGGTVTLWDGSEWLPLAASAPQLAVVHVAPQPDGSVVATGSFQAIDGTLAAGFATWNGSTWRPPTAGLRPSVFAFAVDPQDGSAIAATGGDDDAWTRVARATDDGLAWSDLGLRELPISGSYGDAYALAWLPDGSLVVGGAFEHESGTLGIVRRTPAGTWLPLGTGLNGAAHALLVLPDGSLLAGGSFTLAGATAAARIARWDGSAWHALGSGTDGTVHALAYDADTDRVLVGGTFTTAGGSSAPRVAAWDGTGWSALGTGTDGPVYALGRLANGDLVATGSFAFADGLPAAGVARWNGTAWTACGPGLGGTGYALAALPNGDFVVGGSFATAGGVAAANVARCSGSTWSPLGAGTDALVLALAALPNGDLLVGGFFATADGVPSRRVARLTTTCPATVSELGTGCSGSGAPKKLTAAAPPWVDAVFHADAAGLPATAFALALTSVPALVPPIALDTLFAEAAAGCDLHALPDILEVLVADAAAARSTLLLPGSPTMIGLVFHHQMLVIEVDALLAFVEITVTNALVLTAGAF